MKRNKKNYVIIALILVLLFLSIGYAAFSSKLIINGTAKGTGTWDVKFTSVALKNSAGSTDSAHGSAIVSEDGTKITANINLKYPGDGVILEAVVKNAGNTQAKLNNFTITGADDDLEITKPDAGPKNEEILQANGGTCTAQFIVKWKTNSKLTDLGTKEFTITYDYVQDPAGVEFNATPNHTDAP